MMGGRGHSKTCSYLCFVITRLALAAPLAIVGGLRPGQFRHPAWGLLRPCVPFAPLPPEASPGTRIGGQGKLSKNHLVIETMPSDWGVSRRSEVRPFFGGVSFPTSKYTPTPGGNQMKTACLVGAPRGFVPNPHWDQGLGEAKTFQKTWDSGRGWAGDRRG